MAMTRMARWGLATALALVLALSAALTIVIRAPAAWVADWLQERGKLRLVDARGTAWRGSGMIGISDGRETTLLPGRVHWSLGIDGLAPLRISGYFSHPSIDLPLAVSARRDALTFGKGSARFPAAILAGAGAPFNTVRPGGRLDLAWTDSEIRPSGFAGKLQIDWHDARSALSTVVPLGSYRLILTGVGELPLIELQTISGPLQLQGRGRMHGARIQFSGVAAAEPDMRPALNGLLGVIGKRAGDKVLLAIDT
jgi:general secretion pathway protein N